MPRAASIGLQYKERTKPSEFIANSLGLDRLKAFKAQLCSKMSRVNEALQQLEAIGDLKLHESEPGVQYLDHGILSDFIVGVATTYSTAFAKLQKLRKLGATKWEEEKESKLANLRSQEEELLRHKLESEAKEAMLEWIKRGAP
jgi:hypothetical protein